MSPLLFFFTGLYTCSLLVGGLIGYVLAGSTASLFIGSLCALLLLTILGLLRLEMISSFKPLQLIVGILTLFFLYRLWATGRWMPSAIMACLGIILFVLLFSQRPSKPSIR